MAIVKPSSSKPSSSKKTVDSKDTTKKPTTKKVATKKEPTKKASAEKVLVPSASVDKPSKKKTVAKTAEKTVEKTVQATDKKSVAKDASPTVAKSSAKKTEQKTEKSSIDKTVAKESSKESPKKVAGDTPSPKASAERNEFADLGLSLTTVEALTKKGYKIPTPIQRLVIPLLIAGNQDCIGQAQTGTGKTAAFSLPIIEKITPRAGYVQALILAPTRELAVQVASEIESFSPRGVRVLSVYGGTPLGPQIRALKGGVDIVVGTPGRVMDHMNKGILDLSRLSFLVLDEADEMLAMGFVDDMREVIRYVNKDSQKLFFSATMPREILSLAKEFMPNYQLLAVEKTAMTTAQTEQLMISCRESDKAEILTRVIDANPDFYGIVFCETKRDCDMLLMEAKQRGYDVEAIHGDVAQAQREKTLARFKQKTITILLATDVAARGIDVNDLTHVINYALPRDVDSYVHRIGRTGRAGRKGVAISFVTGADRRRLDTIRRVTKATIETMTLPQPADIIAGKQRHLVDHIRTLEEKGFDQSIDAVYKGLSAEFSDPEIIIKSLLALKWSQDFDPRQYKHISLMGGNDRERNSFDRRDSRSDRFERSDRSSTQSGGVRDFTRGGADVRLFVGLGKDDGYDSLQDVLGYFSKQTGISSNKMHNVRLFDSYTFISLAANDAFSFMEHFNMGVQGRKLVQYAKEDDAADSAPRGGFSQGGDRGRPRGGRSFDNDRGGDRGGRGGDRGSDRGGFSRSGGSFRRSGARHQ